MPPKDRTWIKHSRRLPSVCGEDPVQPVVWSREENNGAMISLYHGPAVSLTSVIPELRTKRRLGGAPLRFVRQPARTDPLRSRRYRERSESKKPRASRQPEMPEAACPSASSMRPALSRVPCKEPVE